MDYELSNRNLNILGACESKLPAVLKKRPVAIAVSAVIIAASIFGVGGNKLLGQSDKVINSYVAAYDDFGNSIQKDLDTQADYAANIIRIAEKHLGIENEEYITAQAALNQWNSLVTLPKNELPSAQYNANLVLYNAINDLCPVLEDSLTGDTLTNFKNNRDSFNNIQPVINRAASDYNKAADTFNDVADDFPANVIAAVRGISEVENFAK